MPRSEHYRVAVGLLENRRHWLAWWDGKIRSLVFDLAIAFIAVPSINFRNPELSAFGVVVLIAATPAFVVRRRFPWLPIAAASAIAIGTTTGWVAAAMVAIYTMAHRRGPGLQLWIATGLTLVVNIAATALHMYFNYAPSWDDVDIYGMAVASLLLGLWFFQRKKLLASLRERAEQAERERDLLAERAVATEHRRIAREMHDVVAHRCSVISLQAGALTMTAPDEHTGEVAEVIRKTSATALTELRSMLRVLRDDEHEEEHSGELANAPTVGSIEALVADAVESGANIRLTMPDRLTEPPSEVGRAAYRVVQEALTNAAKHAPHAAVHVQIADDGEELVATVSNRCGPSTETAAVPGSGLIGMRERVTLACGTLRTGFAEDGGYRVRAVFPLHSEVAA